MGESKVTDEIATVRARIVNRLRGTRGERGAVELAGDVLDALGLVRETRVRWEWPEIPEGWRACDNHTLTDGRMWRTVTAAPKDESPYVHEYEFVEATRHEQERWVMPWASVTGRTEWRFVFSPEHITSVTGSREATDG